MSEPALSTLIDNANANLTNPGQRTVVGSDPQPRYSGRLMCASPISCP